MSTTGILAGLELALALFEKGIQVSRMVAAAQAEGRGLSSDELAEIEAIADEADARLAAEIARAKAEGR